MGVASIRPSGLDPLLSPHNGLMQLQDMATLIVVSTGLITLILFSLVSSVARPIILCINFDRAAVKARQYSHLHASAAKGRSSDYTSEIDALCVAH